MAEAMAIALDDLSLLVLMSLDNKSSAGTVARIFTPLIIKSLLVNGLKAAGVLGTTVASVIGAASGDVVDILKGMPGTLAVKRKSPRVDPADAVTPNAADF
jgi:hypothetical protein